MQDGLRRYGLAHLRTMLADGSLLIDLGYLDPRALTSMLKDAESARGCGGQIDVRLHEVIALDRGLRTLLG